MYSPFYLPTYGVRIFFTDRARAWLGRLSVRGRHLLLFDAVATIFSFVLSLALRFDAPSTAFNLYLAAFLWFIPVLVAVRLAVFVSFRLYQRVWRYASIDELVSVVVGSGLASFIGYGAYWLVTVTAPDTGLGFPRSVPIIDTLLVIVFAGAWRFSFRVAGIRRRGVSRVGAERTIIVGRGSAALSILRQVEADHRLPFAVVGVLADDLPIHQRLMGIPILGGTTMLASAISRHRIKTVLLALPSASGRELRRLVRDAEKLGARCLTVPGIAEIASGRKAVSGVREIDVEDLLRRSPARIDAALVSNSLQGATVLVTGAGGSIGSELARQVMRFEPRHLILLGRGENSIFEVIQSIQSIGISSPSVRVTPVILDVRNADRLMELIAEIKPDVVFHAAAHKHVGFMERYPEEAVATNVFGTQRLLRACVEQRVPRFILISTDKAVNPTSVMGATKRVAELLVQRSARQTGLPYACVRFGNVLSSRGSVVPIFKRQLAQGGPLLVTDPNVSRYFMTIPEAVQLVLQSAVLAQPADTFVLDMGDPVRIVDLATDLAALHGLEIGQDVDLQFIGLQPGEKLQEELVFPDEQLDRTAHEAILRVRNPAPVPLMLDAGLTDLQTASTAADREGVIRGLMQIVPQYRPSELYSALR